MIARVFWPSALDEALCPGIALLYGFRVQPAPSNPSWFTDVVVIGALPILEAGDLTYEIAALDKKLRALPVIPALAGWEAELACVGCCTSASLSTAKHDSNSRDVWIETQTSLNQPFPYLQQQCSRVHNCINWQMFSFNMPVPRCSHLPGPASSSPESGHLPWMWCAPPTGATSLEAAAYYCNHGYYVKQLLRSSAAGTNLQGEAGSVHPQEESLGCATSTAAPTGWLWGSTATGIAVQVSLCRWQAARHTVAQGACWNTQLLNEQLTRREQLLVSEVWQHLAGLPAAVLLVVYRAELLAAVAKLAGRLDEEAAGWHQWLMAGTPGGIKLHAELSYLVGVGVQQLASASRGLAMAVWPALGPGLLWLVALFMATAGLCPGLCLLSDLLLVAAWPLEVGYAILAWLYRLQLTYLRFTWGLMRGTNQMRRRHKQPAGQEEVDAAGEVLMEHLIVGVLLFTPLLALLPTTAVWYVYASCFHLLLYGLKASICSTSRLIRQNPLYMICRRAATPHLFPGALHVVVPPMTTPAQAAEEADVGPAQPPAVRSYVLTSSSSKYQDVFQQGRGSIGFGAPLHWTCCDIVSSLLTGKLLWAGKA